MNVVFKISLLNWILDTCDFDLCLACETWKVELQDCIATPSGRNIFLAGGDERKGVGIAVSNRLMQQILMSPSMRVPAGFACYNLSSAMPNFHSCHVIFQHLGMKMVELKIMYDLLQLVVGSARNTGSKMVFAGDFNGCIGSLRIGKDTAGVGEWRLGPRNTRGDAMVLWCWRMVSTCPAGKHHDTGRRSHGHARVWWMVPDCNSIILWPMGTQRCNKCGTIIFFQLVWIIVAYIASYFLNIATLFLRLTSCALHGPPLGRQDQSQSQKNQWCGAPPKHRRINLVNCSWEVAWNLWFKQTRV